MNSFENPNFDPQPNEDENNSPKGGIGKSLKKAAYGLLAGAMLVGAAHAEDGVKEKESPTKKLEGEKHKDKLESAREELHSMLQEISGGEMTFYKGSLIVRFSASVEIDGKTVTSPSGYFSIEKSALEGIVNYVQQEYLSKKFGNPKFDRVLRKISLNAVKVRIAKVGKPVPSGDESLFGLFDNNASGALEKKSEGDKKDVVRTPEIGKGPNKKTNPEAEDFLR